MAPQYPWLDAFHALVPSLDMDSFRANLEKCSVASGYNFHVTERITATQASLTCADPSCASVENELLALAAAMNIDTGPMMRKVLNQFARPMVEYCWQYRLPEAPCPGFPRIQMFEDFGEMVKECNTTINRRIEDAIEISPITVEPKTLEACYVPACVGFVKRTRSLPYILCPAAHDGLSERFVKYCDITWKYYEYLPGPVPPVPATTAAPKAHSNTAAPRPQGSDTATPLPSASEAVATPPTSTAISQSSSGGSITLMATAIVAVVALFATLVFAWLRHKRRSAPKKSAGEADTTHPMATARADFVTMASTTPYDSETSSQRDFLPVDCARIAAHTLTQVSLIAAGASGLVYLVQDQNGTLFASKQLAKRQLSDAKIDAFIGEIVIAASLQHPNIVQFIGVAGISRHHVQAIFEYMEGGDLRRYLDTTPWQPWTRAKVTIALDVAKALQYIHSYAGTAAEAHVSASSSSGTSGSGAGTVVTTGGIVHRDLKSRNIMLTKELRAKVGDFGVSRTLSTQATMTAGVGTSRWLAPEVIVGSGGAYDAACDVYSFGVVLTELDSHRMPYYDCVTATGEELPEIAILSRVADGSLRPSLLSSCVEAVALLATRCLSYDPTQRPSASELVEELKRILERVP